MPVISPAPPHCVPVLQIGVTGHRDLPGADPAVLRDTVRAVLERLAAAAHGALDRDPAMRRRLYAPAPCQLRCVSCLAAGADRIAAHVALDLGWPLLAMLPFPLADYAGDDPTQAGRDELHALAGRAQAVFECAGTRANAAGYEAVGALLLEQTDILLAVWDGAPHRGAGGTGQVVHEALASGISVLVIAAEAPHAVRLESLHGNPGASVERLVADLLLPGSLARAGSRADIYFTERVRPARLARAIERAVEAALLVGHRPPQHDPAVPADTAAPDTAIAAVIDPHFVAADALATRYAALHRATMMLRYLAVIPATIGAALALDHAGPLLRLGWLLQLSALVGILLLSWADRHAAWHRRFLDYRFVAEHLRHARLLALFGSTASLPSVQAHHATGRDWVGWHLRAVVRELGLVSATMDAAAVSRSTALLTREIAAQIRFYHDRAHRYAALARRLFAIGMALFAAGAALTLLRIAILRDLPANNPFALAALVIPALAPVFLGLLTQSEYGAIARRYGAMSRQLHRLLAELRRRSALRDGAERVAREAAAILLAEVSDWRVLIKARPITPY